MSESGVELSALAVVPLVMVIWLLFSSSVLTTTVSPLIATVLSN